MYILKFSGFSGLSYECARGDRDEVRDYAAQLIRLRRKQGFRPSLVEARPRKSRTWEISEPDDCTMVPDLAGMLYMAECFEYECPECGQGYDDKDDVLRCCAPCDDDYPFNCAECGEEYMNEADALECCE